MRNKLFILLCLISISAFSQSVEDNPQVRNWLDTMFRNVDKNKVPHGILRDYAFELANLDVYNGKDLNDSNYVNRIAFENLLRTIRSATLGAKPFDAKDVLAEQYLQAGKGKGVIGVVLYQYSYIRADALTNNLIRYENEQVYDNVVNGVWQNPYASDYTLGFSAQDSLLFGSVINYSFPNNLWKSNVSPSKIEFDADDGKGYIPVTIGGNVSTVYGTAGVKHLKMKVSLSDGTTLYSHSLAKVFTDEVITRGDGSLVIADRTEDIQATNSYNGIITSGRISYLYSTKNLTRVTKPLIVMEGFDPLEFAPADELAYRLDKRYGSTNLNTFIKGLQKNTNVYNKLREEYDIIYIDMFDCKEYIQANAKLLETAIEKINNEKNANGSTEKNIVIGQSMGGLIARYALKEMENEGRIHGTSLLICHDTPHLGAHVPLGLLYGIYGLLDFYYDKNIIGGAVNLGTVNSFVSSILHCNAAKQMLINYVDQNGNLDNSVHNAWQSQLSQMGYPQGDNGYKMRIVGISNGQTVVTRATTPYLYVDGNISTTKLTELLTELYYFRPLFGTTLGIALQDWQAFVLGILPGSNTVSAHFEVNPGYNTSTICRIYLRYIKKFLWLIKIQRTVYSYQKSWPLSMINYDLMPGSYFSYGETYSSTTGLEIAPWIQNFAKYNLNINASDTLMFIPTVSSLDIGEGKVTLTQSDYEKKYLMDFPPEAPKHTPFDAFYITDGSTLHISFERNMLNWMVEQMKTLVDGPEIGVTGSQYNIRNNTENYTVSWHSSDESVATIDNSGVLNIKKHGFIVLTAICTKGNIVNKFYKYIMVGFPPFVLDWSINSDYEISARCIEPKAEKYLKYISYEWAQKSQDNPSESLNWTQSIDAIYKIAPSLQASKKTIYMRPINTAGSRGNPIFLSIDTTTPYRLRPSNGIVMLSPYIAPYNGYIEFEPNPLYSDKNNLQNEQLIINYVQTFPLYTWQRPRRVEFNNSQTNGKLYITDLYDERELEDWYQTESQITGSYGRTMLTTRIALMNKFNKVVFITPLFVKYSKNGY